jgi:hypothetical protein
MYHSLPHHYLSTSRAEQVQSRAVQRESIAGLKNVRIIARAINMSLGTSPLGLVDSINPVLNFQNDTAILRDDSGSRWVVEDSLRRFKGHGAVLTSAGIHLERFLVGEDVELNT